MSTDSPVCLTVEIPLSGDGFPDAKELKARNAVTDRLDKRRIGRFQGAGGGMGAMDFSYVVTDAASARKEIDAAMAAVMPGIAYTIDEDVADLDDDDDDDDDDGEDASINWPFVIGFLLVVGAIVGGLAWLVLWLLM